MWTDLTNVGLQQAKKSEQHKREARERSALKECTFKPKVNRRRGGQGVNR